LPGIRWAEPGAENGGETGSSAPRQLRGVAAVCPSPILPRALTLLTPGNFVYQNRFVEQLEEPNARKAKLFPGYTTSPEWRACARCGEFDDVITAAYCAPRRRGLLRSRQCVACLLGRSEFRRCADGAGMILSFRSRTSPAPCVGEF